MSSPMDRKASAKLGEASSARFQLAVRAAYDPVGALRPSKVQVRRMEATRFGGAIAIFDGVFDSCYRAVAASDLISHCITGGARSVRREFSPLLASVGEVVK